MDEWTNAILSFTESSQSQAFGASSNQPSSAAEVDELFDRALVHTTKFKNIESIVADTQWVIDRFPDYSVLDLLYLITDADHHRLLPRLHSSRISGFALASSKAELLLEVARAVRVRRGIGNILAELARPSSEKISGLPVEVKAREVDALVQTLFPSCPEISAALKLFGLLTRLSEDEAAFEVACNFLAEEEKTPLPDLFARLVRELTVHHH